MQHQESAPQQKQPPADPSNPYNIDFAKEQRSKRMFIILIATGFILAAILLILGFFLDSIANPPKPVTLPPGFQQPEAPHPPVNSGKSSAPFDFTA